MIQDGRCPASRSWSRCPTWMRAFRRVESLCVMFVHFSDFCSSMLNSWERLTISFILDMCFFNPIQLHTVKKWHATVKWLFPLTLWWCSWLPSKLLFFPRRLVWPKPFLQETIRMFPATPEGSGRITHKKMNLGDYIIPARTQAMVQQEDRNTYKHIETPCVFVCIFWSVL